MTTIKHAKLSDVQEQQVHTAAPWKAVHSDPAEGYDCWWITANHRSNFEKELATVAGHTTTSEANARLIAAAPDLLEAAKTALAVAESWIHDQLDGTSFLEEELAELEPVRAALRKATGAQS